LSTALVRELSAAALSRTTDARETDVDIDDGERGAASPAREWSSAITSQ
jgi:hypothetical protein